ncbi:multidrug effflux MFS transporter [Staphylococcus argensis]|uniref:Bcr/CflA family efflux transporter n=1 Tax=Staphylococcus argensis TaxID=1607738 RepID=A0A2K4FBX4_9STAP|nr:multidrug effflux MFS transporter [Staphylococcus argensis]MCY6992026.1 multidrug effflux MFS transporter [Staphylococcus argensis]POA08868.1 Bcr/CflA family drug resistance efflux transporter [Staphylococcus argensis]
MQSKKGSQVLYIIILGALTAIGAMSIDMFLPGLPEVQRDFNTSASNAQLTLGLFMVGLALGNLFVGPLSDTYGRRRPLTLAMLVFTIASLGIVFAPNIWVMIGLRFIQGLCGGAGAVLSRSIASDLYQGQALTQFMSMLMLVNGIAPVIAPALGGVIITVAHWQVVFMVLVVFGVCLTLGSYMQVGETLEVEQREPLALKSIFVSFGQLLAQPRFLIPMLIQGFTFVLLFSYISASSFITQAIYNLSPLQFSIAFAFVGITLIVVTQLTSKLVVYISEERLLRILTLIQLVGIVGVSTILIAHWHILLLIIGFVVLVSPVPAVATLSFTIAMGEVQRARGSASSLLGLVQYLFGGIVTPLVGLMGETHSGPYLIIIIVTGVILIVLQLLFVRVFRSRNS